MLPPHMHRVGGSCMAGAFWGPHTHQPLPGGSVPHHQGPVLSERPWPRDSQAPDTTPHHPEKVLVPLL